MTTPSPTSSIRKSRSGQNPIRSSLATRFQSTLGRVMESTESLSEVAARSSKVQREPSNVLSLVQTTVNAIGSTANGAVDAAAAMIGLKNRRNSSSDAPTKTILSPPAAKRRCVTDSNKENDTTPVCVLCLNQTRPERIVKKGSPPQKCPPSRILYYDGRLQGKLDAAKKESDAALLKLHNTRLKESEVPVVLKQTSPICFACYLTDIVKWTDNSEGVRVRVRELGVWYEMHANSEDILPQCPCGTPNDPCTTEQPPNVAVATNASPRISSRTNPRTLPVTSLPDTPENIAAFYQLRNAASDRTESDCATVTVKALDENTELCAKHWQRVYKACHNRVCAVHGCGKGGKDMPGVWVSDDDIVTYYNLETMSDVVDVRSTHQDWICAQHKREFDKNCNNRVSRAVLNAAVWGVHRYETYGYVLRPAVERYLRVLLQESSLPLTKNLSVTDDNGHVLGRKPLQRRLESMLPSATKWKPPSQEKGMTLLYNPNVFPNVRGVALLHAAAIEELAQQSTTEVSSKPMTLLEFCDELSQQKKDWDSVDPTSATCFSGNNSIQALVRPKLWFGLEQMVGRSLKLEDWDGNSSDCDSDSGSESDAGATKKRKKLDPRDHQRKLQVQGVSIISELVYLMNPNAIAVPTVFGMLAVFDRARKPSFRRNHRLGRMTSYSTTRRVMSKLSRQRDVAREISTALVPRQPNQPHIAMFSNDNCDWKHAYAHSLFTNDEGDISHTPSFHINASTAWIKTDIDRDLPLRQQLRNDQCHDESVFLLSHPIAKPAQEALVDLDNAIDIATLKMHRWYKQTKQNKTKVSNDWQAPMISKKSL